MSAKKNTTSSNISDIYCDNCKKYVRVIKSQYKELSCSICGCVYPSQLLYRQSYRNANRMTKDRILVSKVKTNRISVYKEKGLNDIVSLIRSKYSHIISEAQINNMYNVLRIMKQNKINFPAYHNDIIIAYVYYITQYDDSYFDYSVFVSSEIKLLKLFNAYAIYKTRDDIAVMNKKIARIKTMLEKTIQLQNMTGHKNPIKLPIINDFDTLSEEIARTGSIRNESTKARTLNLEKQRGKIKSKYRRQWLFPQK